MTAATQTIRRVLLALVLLVALPLAAQETEFVDATSVNNSPFVCTVDGVEQSGTHSQTHTAATRVINLKLANPGATVECSRQQTLRGSVDEDALRSLYGSAEPDPDPPPPPPPPPPDPDPGPLPTPADGFTLIPDVPFDYMAAAGPSTSSGGLPSSLAGGQVHMLADTSEPGDPSITCSGTAENPAFIVGGVIRGSNGVLRVSGDGCFFLGTEFENIQPRTSGSHHVFRGVEIHSVAGKNGSSFGGTNIVVVDSEIHHNQGDDRHGIHVSSGADSVWILRNHVHHNGGDGFQACHGCAANPPRNVYIGGNLFHSDRENAIDFKYIENVIVEGNVIHSLVSAPTDREWCFDDGSSCGVFSSGSDGSAIVVGSDGGPTGVTIYNNDIRETVHAVRIEEGAQIAVWGNRFQMLAGSCLQLDKQGMGTAFDQNYCEHAGRGIFQNWRDNFSLDVRRNTFRNIAGPAIEYESGSVGAASSLRDNLFESTGPVIYNNVSAETAAQINALPNASGNQVQ